MVLCRQKINELQTGAWLQVQPGQFVPVRMTGRKTFDFFWVVQNFDTLMGMGVPGNTKCQLWGEVAPKGRFRQNAIIRAIIILVNWR